jgi:DNA-binding GntR family transcriptional regulator
MAKRTKAEVESFNELIDECKQFIYDHAGDTRSDWAEINAAFFRAFVDLATSEGIDTCVEANNYPAKTARLARRAAAGK